jgi:hypothetical protein
MRRAQFCIREVDSDEPLPSWAVERFRAAQAGMSRATPRYLGGPPDVIGLIAERGGDQSCHPVAVVWCAWAPGRSTVTVDVSRTPAADQALMSRLFSAVRRVAEARGAKWLRWHLSPDDLPLLEAIRMAVGAPVLHREGDMVVAEVATHEGWRSR